VPPTGGLLEVEGSPSGLQHLDRLGDDLQPDTVTGSTAIFTLDSFACQMRPAPARLLQQAFRLEGLDLVGMPQREAMSS
jgi:hypothetical protein